MHDKKQKAATNKHLTRFNRNYYFTNPYICRLFASFLYLRMNLVFRIIFLAAFSFSLISVHAQPGPPLPADNYQIELRTHYGYFLHHHFELERFNSHFPSFELALQRPTFGKQRWESLYNYPIVGVAAFYSPMGGFEELGKVMAVYPFISFPLNENTDNRLNFRLGVGLAWITKMYDPIENYKNYAIGSHLNAAASLYLDYRKRISRRFTFVASGGLTHFSNGSTKTPNFGLNILTASAGLTWYLNRPNPYLDKKFLPILRKFEYDNKRLFSVDVMQSFGTRDMSQQLGKRYFVSNTAVHVLVPVSMKGKLGLAMELTYDGSDKGVLDQREIIEGKDLYSSNVDLLKPGTGIVYEMMLSRASFLFQLGFHLAGAEKSDGYLYEKLGMKFRFSNNLFAVIALTAHGGRADFIGYGIGYQWDNKYYLKRKKR